MAKYFLFHLSALSCILETAVSFKLPISLFQKVSYTHIQTYSRIPASALRSTCQLKISDLSHVDQRRKVKAIITDVDGTLFNSHHSLGPDTRAAILLAMERGIPVVMATGKSRGPWVQQLRASLGLQGQSWNLNGPSVFIQGLMVCDSADRIVLMISGANGAVRGSPMSALIPDSGSFGSEEASSCPARCRAANVCWNIRAVLS